MVQYELQEETPIKLLPTVRNLIQLGLYFAILLLIFLRLCPVVYLLKAELVQIHETSLLLFVFPFTLLVGLRCFF